PPPRGGAGADAAVSRRDEGRDRARLGGLYDRLGRYRRPAGDTDGALLAHRRAAELTPREASVERAAVLGSLGQVKMIQGVFSEGERLAADAMSIARSMGEAGAVQAVHALNTDGGSKGWGADP